MIKIEGKYQADSVMIVVKTVQLEQLAPSIVLRMPISPAALVEVAEELSGEKGVLPANKKQMLELLEYVDAMGSLQHFFAHDPYEERESIRRYRNRTGPRGSCIN